eukprot:COSAG01_NODE_32501_length_580_cov_0.750520_2_plen_137_part_01
MDSAGDDRFGRRHDQLVSGTKRWPGTHPADGEAAASCCTDGRLVRHSSEFPGCCLPQGWSTWYAFGTDINETKIVQMADKLVEHGLRDAGYTFVNLVRAPRARSASLCVLATPAIGGVWLGDRDQATCTSTHTLAGD